MDKFNKKFQNHVVSTILKSYRAAAAILPIIETRYFEYDGNRLLVRELKEYYKIYRTLPSKATLSQVMDDTYHEHIRKLFKKKIPDVDIVVAEVKEFINFQNAREAFYKGAELIERGDIDGVFPLMRTAFSNRSNSVTGHGTSGSFFKKQLLSNIIEITVMDTEKVVPTGFTHLDETMNGGLHPGELGVIMGRLKLGKSFFLLNVAFNAASFLGGLNVVHYTLENSRWKTLRRYYRRLIHQSEITMEEEDVIRERMDLCFTGDVYVQQFPTKKASVSSLYSHMDYLIGDVGFNPDLIVVDYADLLKPERGVGEKRFELSAIFEDLRAMAIEFDVPIWTATQTRRLGHSKWLVDADDASESYEKPQIADVFVTMSRTPEEKANHQIRLNCAAMRDSPSDKVIMVHTDYRKSLMYTTDVADVEELAEKEAQEKENYEKRRRFKKTDSRTVGEELSKKRKNKQ